MFSLITYLMAYIRYFRHDSSVTVSNFVLETESPTFLSIVEKLFCVWLKASPVADPFYFQN